MPDYENYWPMSPQKSPELYLEATLSDFEGSSLPQAKSALITGPPGSGKTRLSWAVYKSQVSKGRKAWFVREADHEQYRFDDEYRKALEVWPWLLIIDDLGHRTMAGEEPDQWMKRLAYIVTDSRLANNRPTMVTTNLDHATLVNAYGAHTVSRLTALSVVKLDGKDRRRG